MRHLMFILAACAISVSPAQAQSDNLNERDAAAISAALDAIEAGKPADAVAKTDEVISRFESRRESKTAYVCTHGSTDMLMQLAGAALATSKDKKGESDTTVAAVSSDVCSAYFLKGFAFVDLDRHAEALANFEVAIAMDSDNTHYLNELGEWYKTDHDWQKALETFTRASEIEDLALSEYGEENATAIRNSRQCRSFRGIAYSQVELRNWAEARAALNSCLAIDPNDPGSRQEMDFIDEQMSKAQ